MVDTIESFTLHSTGTLSTGTNKDTYTVVDKATIIRARADVTVAPVGSSLILDLLLNGTSIYQTSPTDTRPTILAGATETAAPTETVSNDASTDPWTVQQGTGYTQPSPAQGRVSFSDTPNVQEVNPGDIISLSIIQVGSGTAGSNLEVTVEYTPE